MYSVNDLFNAIVADVTTCLPRIGSLIPDSPTGEFGDARGLPCATTAEVAAFALTNSIGKKCVDIVSDNAADQCLLNYLESNSVCANWRPPSKVVPPRIVHLGRIRDNPDYGGFVEASKTSILERMRTCLKDTFLRPTPESLLRLAPSFDGQSPFSWENIFLLGDVGPGAAYAASGNTWYDKFYQSTLTYTSPDIWRAYVQSLPPYSTRWFAENQRNNRYGREEVLGGIFDSVPKNFFTDRSIDKQPSLNMVAQKGLAMIMAEFLKQKYGFDLRFQPAINAELARRGSIDDSNATIDLKDASNRIPWAFVKWSLEGTELLHFLSVLRTEKTLMPWGEWLENHLCSGMGNGFTFVLQTAIFMSLVEAVYDLFGLKMKRQPDLGSTMNERLKALEDLLGEEADFSTSEVRRIQKLVVQKSLETQDLPGWAVFGDDIICPSKIAGEVVKTLGYIGATVNLDKSFLKGDFRESCGMDWYRGDLVRGVYCKTLTHPHDRMITLNRLIEWSCITGIPLRRACTELWKTLGKSIVKVPLHESHFAGLRVPSWRARSGPLSSEIKELQGAYQAKVKTYLAYVPVVRKRSFSGAQLSIYGPGLLLSMIRGDCRSSLPSMTPRIESHVAEGKYILSMALAKEHKETYFEQKWCWTSCWDNMINPYLDAARMDAALALNLGSLPWFSKL